MRNTHTHTKSETGDGGTMCRCGNGGTEAGNTTTTVNKQHNTTTFYKKERGFTHTHTHTQNGEGERGGGHLFSSHSAPAAWCAGEWLRRKHAHTDAHTQLHGAPQREG